MQTKITTQPKQEDPSSKIHAFLEGLTNLCKKCSCSIYLQIEPKRFPTTVVYFDTSKTTYEELEAWGAEASVWSPDAGTHIRHYGG